MEFHRVWPILIENLTEEIKIKLDKILNKNRELITQLEDIYLQPDWDKRNKRLIEKLYEKKLLNNRKYLEKLVKYTEDTTIKDLERTYNGRMLIVKRKRITIKRLQEQKEINEDKICKNYYNKLALEEIRKG